MQKWHLYLYLYLYIEIYRVIMCVLCSKNRTRVVFVPVYFNAQLLPHLPRSLFDLAKTDLYK